MSEKYKEARKRLVPDLQDREVEFQDEESLNSMNALILQTKKRISELKDTLEEIRYNYPLEPIKILDSEANIIHLEKGLENLKKLKENLF